MAESEHRENDEKTTQPEATNFENLARALFRVDKRDVDKHEPKKRVKQPDATPGE